MQYIVSIFVLLVCQVTAFNNAPVARSSTSRISSRIVRSSNALHQSSPNNNNDNNDNDNDTSSSQIVASPSGINILPNWKQQAIFAGTFGTLITSTALLKPVFHNIPNLPFVGQYLWHPELLGLIFVLAGVSHFFVDDYQNIYPPKGTWGGLWQLPGSAKFHVEWTGVAEIVGGVGLFVGLSSLIPLGDSIDGALLASSSAAALLGLAIAIYPANFYMWTHGAELPKGVGMEDSGHYGRFVAQIVLCGILAGLI